MTSIGHKSQRWLDSQAVNFFFGSAIILKKCATPEFIKASCAPATDGTITLNSRLAFQLLVACFVKGLISKLTSFPHLVGFRRTEKIPRNIDYRQEPIKFATEHLGKGYTSSVVSNLASLFRNALASKDLQSLQRSMMQLATYVDSFIRILSLYSAKIANRTIDAETTVVKNLPIVVNALAGEPSSVQWVYFDFFVNPKEVTVDDFDTRLEEDLAKEHVLIPTKKIPVESYAKALANLWLVILSDKHRKKYKDLINLLVAARDWEEIHSFSRRMYFRFIEPEKLNVLRDEFKLVQKIPSKLIQKLVKPCVPLESTKDKLETIFRGCTVKVIANGYGVYEAFIIALRGAMLFVSSRKAKLGVIKFIHNEGSDKSYSYAIRVLPDWSTYWVFLNAGMLEIEAIDEWLRHSVLSRSVVTRAVRIDLEKLEEYVKTEYVKQLETNNKGLRDSNSSLRGDLLELLASEYFWRKKCGPVILSRRLWNKEIDVIATEDTPSGIVLHIAGCKATTESFPASLADDEIRHPRNFIAELRDFEKTFRKASTEKGRIKSWLQLHKDIVLMKGYFITTELWRDIQKTSNVVEVWNWYSTRAKLKEAGVSNKYIQTMEKWMKEELVRAERHPENKLE